MRIIFRSVLAVCSYLEGRVASRRVASVRVRSTYPLLKNLSVLSNWDERTDATLRSKLDECVAGPGAMEITAGTRYSVLGDGAGAVEKGDIGRG